MKRKLFFLNSRNILLVFLFFSLLQFFFSSCKSKDQPKQIAGTCAVLTSIQIQDNWVDNGFTKPGSKEEISAIDVLASYNSISTVFVIYIQGIKSNGDKIPGSEIKIFEGTSCSPPRSTAIPQHNFFKLADLDILEKDGQLKKFSYLSFTPSEYYQESSEENYLMDFKLKIVFNDGTSQAKGGSLPCPPCLNCIPKCPTWCTPPCTIPFDSTTTNESIIKQ